MTPEEKLIRGLEAAKFAALALLILAWGAWRMGWIP